ncbi:hypothetical protein ACMHYB_25630 [Sorangium sp. So ce1128]
MASPPPGPGSADLEAIADAMVDAVRRRYQGDGQESARHTIAAALAAMVPSWAHAATHGRGRTARAVAVRLLDLAGRDP